MPALRRALPLFSRHLACTRRQTARCEKRWHLFLYRLRRTPAVCSGVLRFAAVAPHLHVVSYQTPAFALLLFLPAASLSMALARRCSAVVGRAARALPLGLSQPTVRSHAVSHCVRYLSASAAAPGAAA